MDAHQLDETLRRWTRGRRPLLGPDLASLLGIGSVTPGSAWKEHKKKTHGKNRQKPTSCTPQPTATTCAGRCGPVKDNCGATVDCGTAAACQARVDGSLCCAGACVTGICCESSACSDPTPVWAAHTGVACSDSAPCPTGTCCAADGICGDCLVFVTSESTTGNLDGLTGADARCQADAAANLPGTYLAWLSDSQDSPSTRFVRATAPYRLPDSLTAAWDWISLTGSVELLVHSIDVQADSHTVYHGKIWTNTRRDGASGGINPAHRCDDWRSPSSELRGNYALAIATDDRWTVNASQECDMLGRLYCFQQR